MSDLVNAFLSHKSVSRAGASSESDILEIERHFSLTLPEALRRIWKAGDAIEIESKDASWLCPVEILRFVNETQWPLARQGLLPLLDTHQSNYVVLLTHAPLAPRVAWMPHDDGMRLLYRDFDRFLQELLVVLDGDAYADDFYAGAEGDYGGAAPRDVNDRAAGLQLLQTHGEDFERNLAIQLLDEHAIDAWTRLLNADHFVRRDVLARLRQLSSPQITKLLEQDRAALEKFTAEFAAAAQAAGFRTANVKQGCLPVEGRHFAIEAFFGKRNAPDALPRMMNWLTDILAGRNPNDRPDNIMRDL
jgi:hypothetical protein